MNKEIFIKKIKEDFNISLDPEKLSNLETYAEFLLDYNKTTNLTAIRDINGVYLKHFYDSLTILKSIDLMKINTLCDVGTGAGFPGMVLKIIFPHLSVKLLDSNNKKINFLKELISKLNLKDIEAINARSEEYASVNSDYFDLVTARAVTTLPALVELCLPLVKVGGYFIPLKGNAEEEILISESILKTLNGSIEEIINLQLPMEESTRTIIKIKKIEKNPKGYPRSYDKIKKSLKKYIK